MKRKLHCLVCSVLMSIACSNAQIADEIRSFVDSTELIVNNGRKMMAVKIRGENYAKANEIYKYLTEITVENTSSAFAYNEDIYINLLFGDWHNLETILLDYKTGINKKEVISRA